jgi:hypothetical protein
VGIARVGRDYYNYSKERSRWGRAEMSHMQTDDRGTLLAVPTERHETHTLQFL